MTQAMEHPLRTADKGVGATWRDAFVGRVVPDARRRLVWWAVGADELRGEEIENRKLEIEKVVADAPSRKVGDELADTAETPRQTETATSATSDVPIPTKAEGAGPTSAPAGGGEGRAEVTGLRTEARDDSLSPHFPEILILVCPAPWRPFASTRWNAEMRGAATSRGEVKKMKLPTDLKALTDMEKFKEALASLLNIVRHDAPPIIMQRFMAEVVKRANTLWDTQWKCEDIHA